MGNIENSVSTSGSISLATTAIREVAAGFWGRAFCSAEVESPFQHQLLLVISMYIGRQLDQFEAKSLLEIQCQWLREHDFTADRFQHTILPGAPIRKEWDL